MYSDNLRTYNKDLDNSKDKLRELGTMIKGTAKPYTAQQLERERLAYIDMETRRAKTKGASMAGKYSRHRLYAIEREVKLAELAKMVRGVH